VPQKPAWFSRINEIVSQLDALPRPFIDRATVEFLFGVGRRRAQQILAPLISDHVGANGLAPRDALISYLRRLASGDDAHYELLRRQKVAEALEGLHRERLENPPLLVEAPLLVLAQEFENLPPGVHLQPGRLTVDFDSPQQALEKLLALAMAIRNDWERFEGATRTR
jgi:hypothetical protein